MLTPIEHVTGWLFRVARNRITDLFRRQKRQGRSDDAGLGEEDELPGWEDLLPSTDAGPDAVFARGIVLDALAQAVASLPPEQREVFVAHEFEGLSFKELAERSGVSLNTLLSRKHYAVLQLRRRLADVYDDFTKS
jgi:RNA polymerase sigma factor (sigma-70 family)